MSLLAALWTFEKKELFVTYVLISNVNSLTQTYELFYALILHLMGKMSQYLFLFNFKESLTDRKL